MEIDKDRCVGCGNCILFCTMGVISIGDDGKADVIQDECVECHNCHRTLRSEGRNPTLVRLIRKVLSCFRLAYEPELDVCPTGALSPPELKWPRTVRRAFSDPTFIHEVTRIGGRGTEEIKTNDVTGRLKEGDVGFVVELGRPGTGAHFRDIQKMAMALARLGASFEPNNPITSLMKDVRTGRIDDSILDEKVLSAIIEFKTTMDRVEEFLERIEEAGDEIDTVFSVGISSRCRPDGSISHQAVAQGANLSLNGKTNLGLGRPQEGELS